MRCARRLLFLLLVFCAVGCQTLPDAPSLYDEEIVLCVWDVFDDYYGRETFFECELLPVQDGEIRIMKPYGISRIAVVGYCSCENAPILLRLVQSNPGQNGFMVEGTTLRFHSSREGEHLFVAWVHDVSSRAVLNKRQEDDARK